MIKGAELAPDNAAAYRNRGRTCKAQGKKAETLADFQRCMPVTDNPEWTEAAKKEIEEPSK